MKLREFYEEYLANRKAHDFISAYYVRETGGKPTREHIGEGMIAEAAKLTGLLMQADILQSRIYETEGQAVSITGEAGRPYKCRQWSAELDADQAMIALNIHPALRKPSRTASPKGKAGKRAKGRRFSL